MKNSAQKLETATLAGGCFWCTEALYQRIPGVISIEPGYSGGTVDNPTYEQVCDGTTGHAEAIQIQFDPKVLPYRELIDWFWEFHDPTTLNRQGNDVGPQYRSVIFYHDQKQKADAEASLAELEKSGKFHNPVVTEIVPFEKFYPAEDYHKNYYNTHQNQPYCQLIISPKIHKLKQKLGE